MSRRARRPPNIVRQAYTDLNIQVIPHGTRVLSENHPQAGRQVAIRNAGKYQRSEGNRDHPQSVAPNRAESGSGGAASLRCIGCCLRSLLYGIGYPVSRTLRARATCPGFFLQIDVGVLPSQAPETFSYTLSEFFAARRPRGRVGLRRALGENRKRSEWTEGSRRTMSPRGHPHSPC